MIKPESRASFFGWQADRLYDDPVAHFKSRLKRGGLNRSAGFVTPLFAEA